MGAWKPNALLYMTLKSSGQVEQSRISSLWFIKAWRQLALDGRSRFKTVKSVQNTGLTEPEDEESRHRRWNSERNKMSPERNAGKLMRLNLKHMKKNQSTNLRLITQEINSQIQKKSAENDMKTKILTIISWKTSIIVRAASNLLLWIIF